MMCNYLVSRGDIREPQKDGNLFNFDGLQKCFETARHGNLFAEVIIRIKPIIPDLTFHPNA